MMSNGRAEDVTIGKVFAGVDLLLLLPLLLFLGAPPGACQGRVFFAAAPARGLHPLPALDRLFLLSGVSLDPRDIFFNDKKDGALAPVYLTNDGNFFVSTFLVPLPRPL